MSDSFPMMFRKEQIEAFCTQALSACTFIGPNKDEFRDEHIESIVEEVQNSEADLTAARISIEQYLVNELNKDPGNVIFMRMSDSFKPIFDDVIAIEVKMFGAPKFIVSREGANATAWRMDTAAEAPITSVNLPQDVMKEAAKYNFTTVLPPEYILPDEKAKTSMDTRRSFFAALPVEEENTVMREHDWIKKFRLEASYDLIDRALYLTNFHDQVSLSIIDALREYCVDGFEAGIRNDDLIKYENECPVEEVEIVPTDFIITAANASKRAFFTALQVSGEQRHIFSDFLEKHETYVREVMEMPADAFIDELEGEEKIQRHETEYVFTRARAEVIESLIKMFGKLPIFEHHMPGFKILFKYLCETEGMREMLEHFYVCFNDMISYYEERNFIESANNCNAAKDYISELSPQKVEPTVDEVNKANADTATERATASSGSVFID